MTLCWEYFAIWMSTGCILSTHIVKSSVAKSDTRGKTQRRAPGSCVRLAVIADRVPDTAGVRVHLERVAILLVPPLTYFAPPRSGRRDDLVHVTDAFLNVNDIVTNRRSHWTSTKNASFGAFNAATCLCS